MIELIPSHWSLAGKLPAALLSEGFCPKCSRPLDCELASACLYVLHHSDFCHECHIAWALHNYGSPRSALIIARAVVRDPVIHVYVQRALVDLGIAPPFSDSFQNNSVNF
jgi:hypothetical protein